jgi:hypothetical protein
LLDSRVKPFRKAVFFVRCSLIVDRGLIRPAGFNQENENNVQMARSAVG